MKFSIIVPTYNRAHLISKTLISLLNQEHTSFEIIVVDDGSNDNTEQVISEIKDERIFYYKKNNEERAAARNFGAQKATGDYLAFFDSDDVAYPNHLKVANDIVSEYAPDIFVINYDVKNEKDKVIRSIPEFKDINKQLIYGNLINCSPVFVKKEVANQFPFDEDRVLTGSEDYLLWLQLAARYKFHFSNKKTSALIQHSGRSVLSFDKKTLIARKMLMLQKAISDQKIIEFFQKDLKHLKGNTYSYIALHLALGKYKVDSWHYFKKSISNDLTSFFSKRSLVIIKHLIF